MLSVMAMFARSDHAEPPERRRPHARLDELVGLTADDLLAGLGLASLPVGAALARRLARWPARGFARTVAAFDDRVRADGLVSAGAWIVQRLASGMIVVGRPGVPAVGPLLVVANHPGLLDAPALCAAIGRPDLRIIATERAFLRALPATAPYLIFLGATPRGRLAAIRGAARHLAAGGAVLTFPAGRIEPDPAALDGAIASLDGWAPALAVMLRVARQGTVLPAIVSGVLAPRALRHPLTRLRRGTADREWLAALVQILRPALQDTTVHVGFGDPVLLDRVNAGAAGQTIATEARRLIEAVEDAARALL